MDTNNNEISSLRLLLVEDSEHDRLAFHRALKKSGVPCEIIEFERAEDALARLKSGESPYDIIVSDHNLPGLSGLDLFRELLARKISLPLVLLTGSGTEETAVEALKAGVHDYIIKDELGGYLDLLPVTLIGVVKSHREKWLRIQAEEKLKAAREHAQRLIDSSLDMIISADKDRNVVEFNRAAQEIFGYTKEEVLGKNVGMLYADPSEGLEIKKMLEQTGRFAGEITNKRKNGEIFPSFISATILKNPDGTLHGIMGVSRDITDLKKAQEALRNAKEKAEEATRLKDKFVSLVAHDLRDPLGTMLTSLNLVRLKLVEDVDKEQENILDISIRSGERMLQLIKELLSVSRFKTGKISSKLAFIDAYLLGLKILVNFSYLASQKRITLENRIPVRTRIHADEALIYEVLQNLVSNAVKFCKEGDRITLFVPQGERSTIAVSDTGVGIEAGRLEAIFRYEEKTSTRGTSGELGTGLGLPLCRDIMEVHGGALTVESAKGEGSVFMAKLPYVRPRVLIVEDSQMTRRLIKEILKSEDVEILEAENGQAALDVLKKNIPHLIIMDIMMPVMDGFEFLKRLRSEYKAEPVPVIVTTTDTNPETIDKAFRFGADDFVAKPLAQEDLLPRIRKILV
ncbi:MAG: response regulator [Nitrospinae bacterium]|nr:response regulator [Nitrospinota bacterium]